jgi:hypothetical protein
MSEYSIYTITDEDRQFSESCTPSFAELMIVKLTGRQHDGWTHMM